MVSSLLRVCIGDAGIEPACCPVSQTGDSTLSPISGDAPDGVRVVREVPRRSGGTRCGTLPALTTVHAPRWIRTTTGWPLKPLPLPLGYRRVNYEGAPRRIRTDLPVAYEATAHPDVLEEHGDRAARRPIRRCSALSDAAAASRVGFEPTTASFGDWFPSAWDSDL